MTLRNHVINRLCEKFWNIKKFWYINSFVWLRVSRAFAVVSNKQWFSIGGGKHIGWILMMPWILKVLFNNTNICLLKRIETCFVRYQNCWKHNLFKFLYQCIVIITMLIITMSHLVLFFLILNLTHVCSEISFSEGSYSAGTVQLICVANH